MKIKLSKSQWESIGKTTGWIKTANKANNLTQKDLYAALTSIYAALNSLEDAKNHEKTQKPDGSIVQEYTTQELQQIQQFILALEQIYSKVTRLYRPQQL